MKVKVNNLPAYPLKRWVVARYDADTKALWFYGTWDNESEAEAVINHLGNGILLENEALQ